MQKDRNLGLSVGTQLMGLARLNGRNLEDWQVKNFEGKWSKIKLKIILQAIERYMVEFSVTHVYLKVPEACRSSVAIEELTKGIMRLCEDKRVPVTTYTIVELKRFCNAGNKAELMDYVLSLYPELTHVFKQSRKVKRVYYVKIFEAVASTQVNRGSSK